MKAIKKELDPAGIMAPGNIFMSGNDDTVQLPL
jgi:hypothetical protein